MSKNRQWDLIKFISFCLAKKTIKQKDYLRNSRKYSANDATNKGLICKIYKHFIQLNTKTKTKQTNQKMERRPTQTFLQRRHTNGQDAYEKMLNIINQKRNANQTTMKYYLTLVKIAFIKKYGNSKCWRGSGEEETLLHCWWECNLIQSQ